jgi:hypothetical protein
MDIEEFKKLRTALVETLKKQRAELVEKLRVIDQELSELGGMRRGRKPGVKKTTRRRKSTGKRRGRPPKTAPDAKN